MDIDKKTVSASHTPGPWEVDRTYQWHSKVRSRAEGHSGQWVVDCSYRHEDPAATLANARLIAAAPELLEALREAKGLADMAEMYDGPGDPSEDQAALLKVRSIINAAIAKATGQ